MVSYSILAAALGLLALRPLRVAAQTQAECQGTGSWLVQTPMPSFHSPPYPIHGSAAGTANSPDTFLPAKFNISRSSWFWYPGQTYSLNLTCNSNLGCAFLMTMEIKGTQWGSDSSALLGTWAPLRNTDTSIDASVGYSVRSKGSVIEGAQIKFFQLKWTAPALAAGDPKIYSTMQFRIEAVQNTGTSCQLVYYEVDFPPALTCGDGKRDVLESCDDGNTNNGDGCSSGCNIESSYFCGDDSSGKSVCSATGIVIQDALGNPLTHDFVSETGSFDYYVRLSTPVSPGYEVFVSVFLSANSTGNLTLSGFNQVKFTSTDPGPKQFLILALDNKFADGDRDFNVRHTVQNSGFLDPAYAAVSSSFLYLTVVDDEVADVPMSTHSLTIPEGQGLVSKAYYINVGLATQPYGLVYITPVLTRYTLLGEPFNLTITPNLLVFSTLNYTTNLTVVISSVEDFDCTGDMAFNIGWNLTANDVRDSAIRGLRQTDRTVLQDRYNISITVVDNDTPRIFVDKAALTVREDVSADQYRIYLNSRPRYPVVVNTQLNCTGPRGNPPLGFDPCTLVAEVPSQNFTSYITFNRTNWKLGLVVRVSVMDNAYNDDTRSGTLQHSINTTDPYYTTLNPTTDPGDLSITVFDDDTSGIVYPSAFTIVEGLPPYAFYMNLLSAPYDTVEIVISKDPAATWYEISTQRVVWEPSQWNESRVVQIQSTVFDLVDDGIRQNSIFLFATSEDPKYNDPTGPNGPVRRVINFRCIDDDTAGFKVDTSQYPSGWDVTEGDPFILIPIKITSRPHVNTTVKLTVTADPQLSVEPSFVEFDTLNWATYQNLRVSAVDDTESQGDRNVFIQLTLTTMDAFYTQLTPPLLNVTIRDNDATSVQTTLDKWGGVVCPATPCGGVQLAVPPGTISEGKSVDVTVTQVQGIGAPGQRQSPPSGSNFFAASGVYSFEPHGTLFESPVTISIQYDPDTVTNTAIESFALFRKANPAAANWTRLSATFINGLASIQVTSFSFYYVGIVPGGQQQAAPPPPAMPTVVKKQRYNFVFWIIVGVAAALIITVATVIALVVRSVKRRRSEGAHKGNKVAPAENGNGYHGDGDVEAVKERDIERASGGYEAGARNGGAAEEGAPPEYRNDIGGPSGEREQPQGYGGDGDGDYRTPEGKRAPQPADPWTSEAPSAQGRGG